MSQSTDPGLILLDKEAGLSSRKAAGLAARKLGFRKYGHLGTLDPFATGMLPVMLGRATRLAQFFPHEPKGYEGIIQLGSSTTTDDREGETLVEAPVPRLAQEDLDRAGEGFVGLISQQPPIFSAIHIDGKRAYARARQGERPEMPMRQVQIDELRLGMDGPDQLSFRLVCGGGTYVRSLARDLGRALGTEAHLESLRRQRVGLWTLDQAASLQELEAKGVLGLNEVLGLCGTAVDLGAGRVGFLRQGKDLNQLGELSDLAPGRYALSCAGEPLALVESTAGSQWSYLRVLPEANSKERLRER